MMSDNGSNPTLVASSILVAIFASFTALNVSRRIAAAEPSARRWWIFTAANALGGGTWTMHFVGMLAISMPAAYNVYLTITSLLLPIVVNGIGFEVVSRLRDRRAVAWSGLLVGSGMALTQYTSIAAMQMPGLTVSYDVPLVVASIVIAIVVATAALWLAFRTTGTWQQRLAAAVVMAGAISGNHYAAMAATSLAMDHHLVAAVSPKISKGILALPVIGAVTFQLLLALVTAFFDGKLATLTKREAAALQKSEERNRLLIENTSDVIGILDPKGSFTYVGSSTLHVLGYRSEDIVGGQLTDLITSDSLDEAHQFLATVVHRAAQLSSTELWLANRSGERRKFELTAKNLLHTPEIAGIVVNLRDITERAQLLAELETLSETDLLTQALNRRGFSRQAEREFARGRRSGEKLAIVMMDIDHFKQVNDTYGHAAGDLVLAKTAEACASQIREGDLFGRIGGEEFALLLAGREMNAARDIINRMKVQIAACGVPTIRGEVSVTASFGIAYVDPATTDLANALTRADDALYKAKSAGRDCIKMSA